MNTFISAYASLHEVFVFNLFKNLLTLTLTLDKRDGTIITENALALPRQSDTSHLWKCTEQSSSQNSLFPGVSHLAANMEEFSYPFHAPLCTVFPSPAPWEPITFKGSSLPPLHHWPSRSTFTHHLLPLPTVLFLLFLLWLGIPAMQSPLFFFSSGWNKKGFKSREVWGNWKKPIRKTCTGLISVPYLYKINKSWHSQGLSLAGYLCTVLLKRPSVYYLAPQCSEKGLSFAIQIF